MESKISLTSLTAEQVKNMFVYVGEQVIDSKPLLTEIDSAIGDGDHGVGMSVGFSNANEKLAAENYSDVNSIFKGIGKAMINNMGGASGVIFGTMFASGVKKLESKESLSLELLATIFEKGLIAVKERGKANLGDKTMIDALEPAVESLKNSAINNEGIVEALEKAAESAQDGVEKTKNYIAKFGRAKSLGERAIGHQDAGATTIWIIFHSMFAWVKNLEN